MVAAAGRQLGGHDDGSDGQIDARRVERCFAIDFAFVLVVAWIGQGPGQQTISEGEHSAAAVKATALFFAPRFAAWPGTTAHALTAIASTATERMDLIEISL